MAYPSSKCRIGCDLSHRIFHHRFQVEFQSCQAACSIWAVLTLTVTWFDFRSDRETCDTAVRDTTYAGCFRCVWRLASILCYPAIRVTRILHDIPDRFHYRILI